MLNRLQAVFRSLNSHDVHYVVIGGIAAALHGVPRTTFDLDLLVEATTENVKRLLEAFLEAGLGTAALTSPDGLLANEITVFKDRVRIDVFTLVPGLAFDEAWRDRQTMTYENQTFHVVSRAHLIRAKKASARKIDLEDVRTLELPDE